jgi:hypothetical protein
MWAIRLTSSQIVTAHPSNMERVMGIEPTSSAWKAEVLPLNYTRLKTLQNHDSLYRHGFQNIRLAPQVTQKHLLFGVQKS